MSNINVGDVIWIIDSDRHAIIPARINEQIVSKTIAGEKTYHNLQFPSGKTQKLENLSAAWYPDLSGVRAHLLERAQELIEKTVMAAKDIAQKKFEISFEEDVFEQEVNLREEVFVSSPEIPDSIKVSLDDGQVVNVKVPKEFLDENFSG